ncbi:cyclase family protein [Roseovarius sp. SCSIO 43702]|uniref:cyclase family protein n=1 Tax=Roseovarius sp. SCSIO 43702 TaxID=2823043 RepID=UPI001C736C14|nr:cyclase family protein [Roseovarius sp. SCSIO 43702]QYX57508.1 cyclase family protein [Roseovarius sp. SCSIO 43702]
MCDICVMNKVKERMLSRRGFFTAAAATGAAAAMTTVSAPRAMAAGHGEVTDMTHTLSGEFPTYSGEPGFAAEKKFSFDPDGYNLMELTISEHTGTHIDAPLHFSADGASVDEIPVTSLVAPLCVIDIAARAEEDADAQVTPEDIKAWIDANGEIPENACIAMHSGWGGKTGSDAFRGFDGEAMHFPGFHIDAANMLMEETGAQSIAVDTLSLDHGPSADFAVHYAWLPTGRFGIECLANLDRVPASGATIVIGAPKHEGGTGGPARIFVMA